MGLEDDLLSCLAMERQAHALYGQWSASMGANGTHNELLGRLADQSDRHRASLWNLVLGHHVTPPPRLEPMTEADRPFVEQVKLTLRRAIAELSRLAGQLAPAERNLIERMRNEDEAQLRQLLILSPESPRGLTSGRPATLYAREPRWRPGFE